MKTIKHVGVLLGMALHGLAGHAGTIYVGQITALSGPVSSIGIPVSQGAHAYFNKVNAQGGINGNRVELIDKDDMFAPDKTFAHAKALLAETPAVAILNILGAPNNGNLARDGVLKENAISIVGAFTGATSVRGMKSPYIYFVRAGVGDEAKTIVRQLRTMGLGRIALLRANDAFGVDAQEQIEAALAASSMPGLVHVETYEPASAVVTKAVEEFRKLEPQAVVVFGSGAAASKFVAEYRRAGGGSLVIASSATSADVMVNGAGRELARGVGLVQVTPPVTRTTVPIVKEYVEVLAAHGSKGAKPSTSGLEGYMAAKVLIEAIRRSGPAPTRASVSKALGTLGKVDLGGFDLDYSMGRREGSRFVQIGIIGPDGKLLN